MLITMSMDSDAKCARDRDYSQEVMGGEWNPVVSAMQEVVDDMAGQLIRRYTLPADLVEIDIEAFLRKMYAAQQ